MTHHLWYNPDGQPVSRDEGMALLEDFNARQIAHTTLVTERGTVCVSTIFLVINHSWTGDGPPVLWETMVFGGPIDQGQWRYASRESAIEGHAHAVTWARTALDVAGVTVITDETVGAISEPLDSPHD